MMRRTAFAFVAIPVIKVMSTYNKKHCRYKQPVFKAVEKLFDDKEYETHGKYYQGKHRAMMFEVTMNEGIRTYQESEGYHTPLKQKVMNNINAK